MNEYKVKQLQPSHADHISRYKEKWLNEMFNSETIIAQKKYDGERVLIHFDGNDVYITSRRISKKTGHYQELQNKIINLPILKNKIGYTILDAECYSTSWNDIVSILHSLPERAKELQNKITVNFAVFDCLFFDGQDIRNLKYSQRYEIAQNIVLYLQNQLFDSRFHIVENKYIYSYDEAISYRDICVNSGYEGIVIKSLNKTYDDKGAMLKCKKFETIDCVVYDYQRGTGKYSNTVGALFIGYYDPSSKSIKHLSKVNCGTDKDREWWKNYFNSRDITIDWRVIEVKCQEITSKSLRHPVYIRRRDDKSFTDCIDSTIFNK